MVFKKSCLIILITLASVTALANSTSDSVKRCSNGKIIRLTDLVAIRTPNFNVFSQGDFPNYPLDCIIGINKDLTDLKKNWKDEDLKNWQLLSNQFCSHQDGWVEYTPGTCTAGGPPPICPANHWYKDPILANKRWTNLQDEIRQERLKEVERTKKNLYGKACNCWAKKIDENYLTVKKTQTHAADQTVQNQITVITAPCLGTIPPGYKCVNGYLVPENEIQKKITEKINDLTIDQVKEDLADAVKNVIPTFGKYYELLNNTFLKTGLSVVTGVFQSQYLGTYRGEYARKLTQINYEINELEKLGQELLRLRTKATPCLCRDEETILKDVDEVKGRLSNTITLFNLNYQGALKEDICSSCCPNAFTALTQKVNQLYADIMTSIK